MSTIITSPHTRPSSLTATTTPNFPAVVHTAHKEWIQHVKHLNRHTRAFTVWEGNSNALFSTSPSAHTPPDVGLLAPGKTTPSLIVKSFPASDAALRFEETKALFWNSQSAVQAVVHFSWKENVETGELGCGVQAFAYDRMQRVAQVINCTFPPTSSPPQFPELRLLAKQLYANTVPAILSAYQVFIFPTSPLWDLASDIHIHGRVTVRPKLPERSSSISSTSSIASPERPGIQRVGSMDSPTRKIRAPTNTTTKLGAPFSHYDIPPPGTQAVGKVVTMQRVVKAVGGRRTESMDSSVYSPVESHNSRPSTPTSRIPHARAITPPYTHPISTPSPRRNSETQTPPQTTHSCGLDHTRSIKPCLLCDEKVTPIAGFDSEKHPFEWLGVKVHVAMASEYDDETTRELQSLLMQQLAIFSETLKGTPAFLKWQVMHNRSKGLPPPLMPDERDEYEKEIVERRRFEKEASGSEVTREIEVTRETTRELGEMTRDLGEKDHKTFENEPYSANDIMRALRFGASKSQNKEKEKDPEPPKHEDAAPVEPLHVEKSLPPVEPLVINRESPPIDTPPAETQARISKDTPREDGLRPGGRSPNLTISTSPTLEPLDPALSTGALSSAPLSSSGGRTPSRSPNRSPLPSPRVRFKLERRGNEPAIQSFGGFVRPERDLEQAAANEKNSVIRVVKARKAAWGGTTITFSTASDTEGSEYGDAEGPLEAEVREGIVELEKVKEVESKLVKTEEQKQKEKADRGSRSIDNGNEERITEDVRASRIADIIKKRLASTLEAEESQRQETIQEEPVVARAETPEIETRSAVVNENDSVCSSYSDDEEAVTGRTLDKQREKLAASETQEETAESRAEKIKALLQKHRASEVERRSAEREVDSESESEAETPKAVDLEKIEVREREVPDFTVDESDVESVIAAPIKEVEKIETREIEEVKEVQKVEVREVEQTKEVEKVVVPEVVKAVEQDPFPDAEVESDTETETSERPAVVEKQIETPLAIQTEESVVRPLESPTINIHSASPTESESEPAVPTPKVVETETQEAEKKVVTPVEKQIDEDGVPAQFVAPTEKEIEEEEFQAKFTAPVQDDHEDGPLPPPTLAEVCRPEVIERLASSAEKAQIKATQPVFEEDSDDEPLPPPTLAEVCPPEVIEKLAASAEKTPIKAAQPVFEEDSDNEPLPPPTLAEVCPPEVAEKILPYAEKIQTVVALEDHEDVPPSPTTSSILEYERKTEDTRKEAALSEIVESEDEEEAKKVEKINIRASIDLNQHVQPADYLEMEDPTVVQKRVEVEAISRELPIDDEDEDFEEIKAVPVVEKEEIKPVEVAEEVKDVSVAKPVASETETKAIETSEKDAVEVAKSEPETEVEEPAPQAHKRDSSIIRALLAMNEASGFDVAEVETEVEKLKVVEDKEPESPVEVEKSVDVVPIIKAPKVEERHVEVEEAKVEAPKVEERKVVEEVQVEKVEISETEAAKPEVVKVEIGQTETPKPIDLPTIEKAPTPEPRKSELPTIPAIRTTEPDYVHRVQTPTIITPADSITSSSRQYRSPSIRSNSFDTGKPLFNVSGGGIVAPYIQNKDDFVEAPRPRAASIVEEATPVQNELAALRALRSVSKPIEYDENGDEIEEKKDVQTKRLEERLGMVEVEETKKVAAIKAEIETKNEAPEPIKETKPISRPSTPPVNTAIAAPVSPVSETADLPPTDIANLPKSPIDAENDVVRLATPRSSWDSTTSSEYTHSARQSVQHGSGFIEYSNIPEEYEYGYAEQHRLVHNAVPVAAFRSMPVQVFEEPVEVAVVEKETIIGREIKDDKEVEVEEKETIIQQEIVDEKEIVGLAPSPLLPANSSASSVFEEALEELPEPDMARTLSMRSDTSRYSTKEEVVAVIEASEIDEDSGASTYSDDTVEAGDRRSILEEAKKTEVVEETKKEDERKTAVEEAEAILKSPATETSREETGKPLNLEKEEILTMEATPVDTSIPSTARESRSSFLGSLRRSTVESLGSVWGLWDSGSQAGEKPRVVEITEEEAERIEKEEEKLENMRTEEWEAEDLELKEKEEVLENMRGVEWEKEDKEVDVPKVEKKEEANTEKVEEVKEATRRLELSDSDSDMDSENDEKPVVVAAPKSVKEEKPIVVIAPESIKEEATRELAEEARQVSIPESVSSVDDEQKSAIHLPSTKIEKEESKPENRASVKEDTTEKLHPLLDRTLAPARDINAVVSNWQADVSRSLSASPPLEISEEEAARRAEEALFAENARRIATAPKSPIPAPRAKRTPTTLSLADPNETRERGAEGSMDYPYDAGVEYHPGGGKKYPLLPFVLKPTSQRHHFEAWGPDAEGRLRRTPRQSPTSLDSQSERGGPRVRDSIASWAGARSAGSRTPTPGKSDISTPELVDRPHDHAAHAKEQRERSLPTSPLDSEEGEAGERRRHEQRASVVDTVLSYYDSDDQVQESFNPADATIHEEPHAAPQLSQAEILAQIQALMGQLNAQTRKEIVPTLGVSMECEYEEGVEESVEVEISVKVRYKGRNWKEHKGVCEKVRGGEIEVGGGCGFPTRSDGGM